MGKKNSLAVSKNRWHLSVLSSQNCNGAGTQLMSYKAIHEREVSLIGFREVVVLLRIYRLCAGVPLPPKRDGLH